MSSDEVRDVIATLREVPRYVVRNDALTSRAVVGFDKWKGTTDVVLHADHLTAMQEKDRRHAEALAEAYVECDQMVDSAATAGVRLGRAEALRQAREAVKHFHVGSCRWYYTERRCTCGLHDAIDALTTKGATDDVGTG